MKSKSPTRSTLALALAGLGILGWSPSPPLLAQDAPAADNQLRIMVIEGDNSINSVKRKTATRPMVEVRDRNNLPLPGATVLFTLPSSGPGASFANGAKTLTLVSDDSGRATAGIMTPVGIGPFTINVTASFQGHTGNTTISQTNVTDSTAVATSGGGGSSMPKGAFIAILAGVAAAVGTGIAVGLNNSSGNKPAAGGPPTTISLGGSTVSH